MNKTVDLINAHYELRNWSRWSWTGRYPHPLPSDRAMSIEGKFIRDSAMEREAALDEVVKKEPPPHRESAERVERIYQDKLTKQEQAVVLAEYPRRRQSGRLEGENDDEGIAIAAQRLRMTVSQYRGFLRSAKRQVRAVFED